MIAAFLVAMAAVVLAEMGDKTQLLAMAFAARVRWQTVLWAVLAATLVNHLLAVVAGNLITGLIPMAWIKLLAAVSFVLFALWTIKGDSLEGEDREKGRSPFWTVATAFFFAEMGDKTQLMTVALAAREAVKAGGAGFSAKAAQIIPVWMGTTSGMVIADAFGILVGVVLHRHIPERMVKWLAALSFAGFGMLGLHEALDELFPGRAAAQHLLLGAGALLVPVLMLLVAAATGKKESAGAGGVRPT